MSGWGLRDQWEATRHFKRKMWRDSSFLHQLSENGSLLLDENCDRLYLGILSKIMGFDKRISWQLASEILLKLPAQKARRILWLASYRWWTEIYRRRTAALMAFSSVGLYSSFADDVGMEEANQALKLRARQLKNLRWCYEDQTPTFEPIPVVERNADGQKRIRRRRVVV
jgi:hypothetical protein